MTVYRSGKYKLSFSMEMKRVANAHQQDFMQEHTQWVIIYAYLEDYTGDRVCSKQLYEEALGNFAFPGRLGDTGNLRDYEYRHCGRHHTGLGSLQKPEAV